MQSGVWKPTRCAFLIPRTLRYKTSCAARLDRWIFWARRRARILRRCAGFCRQTVFLSPSTRGWCAGWTITISRFLNGLQTGLERILELLKENDPGARPEPHCDAYVLHQGEAARTQAFAVSEQLRAAGLSVVQHCSGDGAPVRFKTQMKHADASGAQYAVIIGEDEVNSGTVTIKALRRAADALEGNAAQRRIAVECLSRDLFEKGG